MSKVNKYHCSLDLEALDMELDGLKITAEYRTYVEAKSAKEAANLAIKKFDEVNKLPLEVISVYARKL